MNVAGILKETRYSTSFAKTIFSLAKVTPNLQEITGLITTLWVELSTSVDCFTFLWFLMHRNFCFLHPLKFSSLKFIHFVLMLVYKRLILTLSSSWSRHYFWLLIRNLLSVEFRSRLFLFLTGIQHSFKYFSTNKIHLCCSAIFTFC